MVELQNCGLSIETHVVAGCWTLGAAAGLRADDDELGSVGWVFLDALASGCEEFVRDTASGARLDLRGFTIAAENKENIPIYDVEIAGLTRQLPNLSWTWISCGAALLHSKIDLDLSFWMRTNNLVLCFLTHPRVVSASRPSLWLV